VIRFVFAGLGAVMVLVSGCATAPPAPDACDAARVVLLPVINAAIENGHDVEIETRTSLTPPPSDQDRWREIRAFGFVPVWRSGATDRALRQVYWRTWRDLPPELRAQDRDEADRRAWEAAYAEIGDDRVYPDEALWSAFFQGARRSEPSRCAGVIAAATGARLVEARAPRGENAVRLTPAAPGLHGEWVLMAAQAVYPPLEPGGEARETGTIWLVRLGAGGDWRVFSARRIERLE
jgi:hypothetical protein